MRYCGRCDGSAGAFGFFRGWRASQAVNAFRYSGRSRLIARRNAGRSCAMNAVAAALNETESSVRICVAWISATLALLLVEEALASDSDDSVPHLAAEKPDQAA